MSQVCIKTESLVVIACMGPQRHKREEAGFSTDQSTPYFSHQRMQSTVNRAHFSESSKLAALGAPDWATVNPEQGVPKWTYHTLPILIQCLIAFRHLFESTLKEGPKLESIGKPTRSPCSRQAPERCPVPEKISNTL